jgi:hypothetical protein
MSRELQGLFLASGIRRSPSRLPAAGAALVLLLIGGCSTEDSGVCRSDDDCQNGELCDLISGNCVPGEATGEEGEFGGGFTCEIGGDISTAPFSGNSEVIGLWEGETLRLADYDLCYLEPGGEELSIELHGTRSEGDEQAHYILLQKIAIEELDGMAELDHGEPGDENCFIATLYRAVVEGDQVVVDPYEVGGGVGGHLVLDGDGQVGEHLEGVLELFMDASL